MVFSYPSLSSWNNLAIHWFFLLFWCRILCTNIVQKHSESVEVGPYNNSLLVKPSTLNRFPCQCRFYANSKSNHSLRIVAGLLLKSILVTFQSLYISLGGKLSHVSRTLFQAYCLVLRIVLSCDRYNGHMTLED